MMNDLLPVFGGIFLRATGLMVGALLLVGLLQRRRPLVASSVLTATLAGLLVLPVLLATLPPLPIPVAAFAGADAEERNGTMPSAADRGTETRVATSELEHTAFDESRHNLDRQRFPAKSLDTNVIEPLDPREQEPALAGERPRDGEQPANAPAAAMLASGSSWTFFLMTVYLLGVVFFSLRLAIGFWSVHRLRTTSSIVEGDWVVRLAGWQERLPAPRRIELLTSTRVHVPMTVGWRQPAILIPESMLEVRGSHQDAVLLHELAHICRRDFLDVVLLQVTQALYWCHPLAWIIGSVGRHLRERACDDLCIHRMGASDMYRNALLSIARQTICKPRLALGLAMAHSSRLSRRLAHIDCSTGNGRCIPTKVVRISAAGAMLVIATLAAAVQFVPQGAAGQTATKTMATDSATEIAIAEPATETTITPVASAAPAQKPGETNASYEKEQAALENRGNAPDSLVAILGSSKLKHWSYVNAVAWSPDGSLLGSVGGDGCLRLWNPDSGDQVKRFKSEPAWEQGWPHLTSLAFDPAGKHVAVGLGTYAVRIWNIETGAETHFLKDDAPVQHIAWHPSQPLLATGGELVARLWDLSTGKIVRSLEPEDKSFKREFTADVVHVTFTPDGQHVIVGHPDGHVRYWNAVTGDVTRTIQAHKVAIQALRIDPGRDWLATGGREGKLRLWRLSTGEMLRDIQAHANYIQGLSFHPRQDIIYSGGLDGAIRTWNAQTGEKLFEFTASRHIGPSTVAMHPTRDLIVSAGYAIRLWNPTTGQPQLDVPGHLGGIQSLTYTPDATRLITSGNDTTVRVWDARNFQTLATYEFNNSPVARVTVTPDGKYLITLGNYGGTIDLRNLADGAILKSWKGAGSIHEGVAISPDSHWLAATAYDRSEQASLTILNLSNQTLHGTIQTHRGRPHFSHDGKQLLVVGSAYQGGSGTKSRLSVWDVESRKSTLSIDDFLGLATIGGSALSADGTTLALAATAYDKDEKSHNQIVFWDWTKNETRLVVNMQEHSPDIIAYAPDGQSVFTAAALQGEARIWDPRDGALRETFKLCAGGHWAIGPAAFTADSRQVAVAMGNGTIDMIGTQRPPANVAVKVNVPPQPEEPRPDLWKDLVGQPAPEIEAQGWLFGDPTTLAQLRGRWVVLYFWNNAFSDQDMAAWMELQARCGGRGPTIVIVKSHLLAKTIEEEQTYFEGRGREWWGSRPLPFRVLIDKRDPRVIPGTKIETGGATHAAYRVQQSRRGYLTDALALLIGPDGRISREIASRPSRSTIRELQAQMNIEAVTPLWETILLREYELPRGVILRHRPPPYSQAREEYGFFRFGAHGRFGTQQATMVFEQGPTLQQTWATGGGKVSLRWVLDCVAGFKNYEFLDPHGMLERTIAGDWCVRAGSPREQLLQAVQGSIEQAQLGWKVRFERETARQPVVVATGKWQPVAVPGMDNQRGIFLTVDDTPDPKNGGGGSWTLDEMFGHLGDRVHRRFINEVTDAPQGQLQFQERLGSHANDFRDQTAESQEKMTRLLNNLSRQTGLTFKLEERDVVVWRIVAD